MLPSTHQFHISCSHPAFVKYWQKTSYKFLLLPLKIMELAAPDHVHQGFQFDPLMTPERKKQKDDDRRERERIVAERSQPASVWCKCQKCTETGNPIEHLCCHTDEFVMPWLAKDNLTCITLHEGFNVTVMNIHSLNVLKKTLLWVVKCPDKRERLRSDDNATKRHLAYINFRSWVTGDKKMGKGNRIVTPACVLNEVRTKWPEQSGIYTGFRAVANTLDDL